MTLDIETIKYAKQHIFHEQVNYTPTTAEHLCCTRKGLFLICFVNENQYEVGQKLEESSESMGFDWIKIKHLKYMRNKRKIHNKQYKTITYILEQYGYKFDN